MWFMAIKHLVSRKSQSLLTFLAILLGAGGYVVFSGMQLGFQEFMIDRLIERSGHITIATRNEFITAESISGMFFPGSSIRWINTPSGRRSYTRLQSASQWYRKLKNDPEVQAYAPQISKEAIIEHRGFTQSVNLIGIDPELQTKVTNIEADITSGNLSAINSGASLIFIGERLMQYLGVRVNDTVNISTSGGNLFPMKIIGTFSSGDRRSDERTIYTSITTVQNISSCPGEITSIVVKIKNFDRAAEIATAWNSLTSDRVESWDQLNSDRLGMMETQDIVRNVTTMAFIIIVGFGIYNILNMAVNHKMRDIAILRSIGYTELDTVFLFLIQGVILGLAGSIMGLVIGYFTCKYIETIKIPGARGNMMISWNIAIYIKSFLLVNTATLIASFFPARTAGKLSPIDIIRGSA